MVIMNFVGENDMNAYAYLSAKDLAEEKNKLTAKLDALKAKGISLDMSRGKPGFDNMDLSGEMFDLVGNDTGFKNISGIDCRNYGGLDGLAELKILFGKILGLDKKHNLVLIGAGNLGQALANYVNFERRGFIIRGIFDKNPKLYGQLVRNIEIRPYDEMKSFVLSNDIDIAVLTIPKESAVTVADELVDCGIKAIWNFAHVDLNVPEGIVVENVHLSESLMKLSYDLNSQGNKH